MDKVKRGPGNARANCRDLIITELERIDLTPNQRIQLLDRLADLQIVATVEGRDKRKASQKKIRARAQQSPEDKIKRQAEMDRRKKIRKMPKENYVTDAERDEFRKKAEDKDFLPKPIIKDSGQDELDKLFDSISDEETQ
jgi:hypothetical protein